MTAKPALFERKYSGFYTRERKHFLLIRRGFLSSGGVGKPQECLLPFKVFPRRLAAKRPAQ
ncbi:MAG: hypothetical protein FWF85_05545 [Clostridiales bacterium]|nr:hypothetical protein [Clostridiales bacterium]